MYVYVYLYMFMYGSIIDVRTHGYIYICMYVCVTYFNVYICMYLRTHVCMCIYGCRDPWICVYMCIYIYIYICIYIYMHDYTHVSLSSRPCEESPELGPCRCSRGFHFEKTLIYLSLSLSLSLPLPLYFCYTLGGLRVGLCTGLFFQAQGSI